MAVPALDSERRALLHPTAPQSSAASFISIASITEDANPPADHLATSLLTRPVINPAPSRRNSTVSTTSTIVAPSKAKGYRGYKSEKEYLEALRAWVEGRDYVESETALIGWYGTKTTQDRLNQPGLGLGLRSKRKAKKEEKARSKSTGSILSELPEGADGDAQGDGGAATKTTTTLPASDAASPNSSSSSSRVFRWPRRGSKAATPVERTTITR